MAAELGNDYSSKNNRLWRETLRRVAAQNPAKLREIAEALYSKAAEGDVAAIREIGDRLDGKAAQALQLTGEDGGPVQLAAVEWNIVKPKD